MFRPTEVLLNECIENASGDGKTFDLLGFRTLSGSPLKSAFSPKKMKNLRLYITDFRNNSISISHVPVFI